MSRSDPPRSSIVARLRRNSSPDLPSSAHAHPVRRKLSIRFAKLMRWLHIYLSMFGLAAVLFFSVTGITLNHPDWVFGQVERRREAAGQVDLEMDQPPGHRHEFFDRPDRSSTCRQARSRRTPAENARDPRCPRRISRRRQRMHRLIQRPGYSADAFIDRDSGHYTLTEIDHGLIALVNDLHKGRDTGAIWSLVIDLSAGLMTSDLADRAGLALLSEAQARCRRDGGARGDDRARRGLSVWVP